MTMAMWTKRFLFGRPRRRLAGVLVGALLIAGCALGRVIVAYHVTIQIETRAAESEPWRTGPGEIVTEPPHKWEANQFPSYLFQEKFFVAGIGTGTEGPVLYALNKSQDRLCLRMDEARMASNFAKELVPLRALGPFWPVHAFFDLKYEQRIEVRRQGRQQPPPMCLAPGQSLITAFEIDTHALFPSGHMFDVAWPEGVPELTSRGVGNWFVLEFPIERGGIRTYYKFTLTARDSKARPLRT